MRTLAHLVFMVVAGPWAGACIALTFGYDIEIRNSLAVQATIEVSQYHSEGFDGNRPKEFTEQLRLSTRAFSVAPNSSRTVHFNDATGGFWLLWRRTEPTNLPAASGVIELGGHKRVIEIK